MAVVLIWFVCAFTAMIVAQSRNASAGLAFVLGLLLGPFGIVIAFVLKPRTAVVVAAAAGAKPPGFERECPYCKSTIPTDASVCRYCQRESKAVFRPVFENCPNGRPHRFIASTQYPGYVVCRDCNEYAVAG